MEINSKIIYDIEDKISYSSTYPIITNKTFGALHEIHIFLLPLNPDALLIEKAMDLTDKFNDSKLADLQDYKMKMCFLTLVFRNLGPVKVLQSARYFRSNDQNEIIKQAYIDANFFVKNGFNVVRVKIEATANGNEGIPQENDEVKAYPKYFEFHVKVQHKNAKSNEPITKEESDKLLEISEIFTQSYKTPVPLSWNNLANCNNPDNPGYQRFLNVRFREIGFKQCKILVDKIKESIESKTNFKVMKSIDEYVWFDTYTLMDHGWIDFTNDELSKIIKE